MSAGHGEGRRRREVRRFPTKEAASGQGATDSRPAGPRGQARPTERPRPSGERESEPVEEKEVGAAWLNTGVGPNLRNKTFSNFI
jgi:hypothetical protein